MLRISTLAALTLSVTSLFASAEDPKPAAVKPNLHVLVVDRSYSIYQNKLVEPVIQAVNNYVSPLPVTDELWVTFFSDGRTPSEKFKPLDLKGKSRFNDFFVKNFKPDGQTHLYDTVDDVIAKVNKVKHLYDEIRVMILSDGADNISPGKKSWAEVQVGAGLLKQDHEKSFLCWYTLGFKPEFLPDERFIQTERVPDASRGFRLEPAPVAAFEVFPAKALPNEKVVFVVVGGAGKVEEALWDFGDGSKGTGSRVSHAYAAEGVYSPVLIVKGPGGSATNRVQNAVEIKAKVPLTAAFSASATSAVVGQAVQFFDRSEGGPTTYEWKINGTSTSTEKDPMFRFSQIGEATIQLEIKRDNDVARHQKIVAVRPPPPSALFTVQPYPEISPDQEVSFAVETPEADVQYDWSVDGVSLGAGASMRWKPTAAGMKTVTLSAKGAGGATDHQKSIYVREATAPRADFEIRPGLNVLLGTTVECVPTDDRPDIVRTWSCGDATSTTSTFSFRLDTPGVNTILHRAVLAGKTSEVSKAVFAIPPDRPVADFTSSAGWQVKQGQKILLTAVATHPSWTHTWTIPGLDMPLTGAKVEWTPAAPGTVEVKQVVKGPGGEDLKVQAFSVGENLTATFTASRTMGIAPLNVSFEATIEGEAQQILFDFGDGATAPGKEVKHSYEKPGEYTPKLLVVGKAGGTVTVALTPEEGQKVDASGAAVIIATTGNKYAWLAWPLGALLIGLLLYKLVFSGGMSLRGSLTWSYQGKSSTKPVRLSGDNFALTRLAIPGWKPAADYVVTVRKIEKDAPGPVTPGKPRRKITLPGTVVLRNGTQMAVLEPNKPILIENVTITLKP